MLALERNGIDDDVGKIVDESLLAELRKLTRTSVIGMAEVRQMLDFEATRQTMGCEDDKSCLAELADSLGVDVLVAGGLTRVGTESVIVVRRIEQQTASVAGTFTRRLVAENGEELLAAIGPAVEHLFSEVPLRAGQTHGVDPKLALRLNPPPLPAWFPPRHRHRRRRRAGAGSRRSGRRCRPRRRRRRLCRHAVRARQLSRGRRSHRPR